MFVSAADDDSRREGGEGTATLESRLTRYPAARYPVQHATMAFHLGTTYLQHGRAPEALETLREAHDLFDRLGMRLEHAKALMMYGVALREVGRAEAAGEAFARAIQMFGDLGRAPEAAAASYNRGLVLEEQGDAAGAQQALAHARALFLRLPDPARAGMAARELGASLLSCGEVESALTALANAVSLAERGRDLPGIGAAANVLGLAHLAAADPVAAVQAFSSAVGAFPRSLRPAEHAMVKANLAVAHERVGDAARARLAARQALAVTAADPAVREQAKGLLYRLRTASRADLLSVLDAEPTDRWPAIVREEALRWCDAGPAERSEGVDGFVGALLSRPAESSELARALLAVLLELPPGPYHLLVTAVVQATGARAAQEGERARALVASALVRFPMPQWQRLVASLNAAAVASGQPAGWR